MTAMLLLMLKMATLMGKRDKVGEDHPSNADMEQRLNRTRLNVLVDVPIHGLVG